MQAVILAGGLGTRLAEETALRPKPMVEIGGKPILWHIMKIYSHYGINDFIICLGYKGYMIKEYFLNYYSHMSDITVDLSNNSTKVHNSTSEPWRITLVDTGNETLTGGRLKRVSQYINGNEFCFTYGDGLADVNISELIESHKRGNRLATVTAVQPPGRFGSIMHEADQVVSFQEKPKGDGAWINGGFFVLSPEALKYIDDDFTTWEQEPMKNLSQDGQMSIYFHKRFWQPMDTLRDKQMLDSLWKAGNPPWRVWNEKVTEDVL